MPDNLNMDEVAEARRSAIADTIHVITVESLKALGEELFPVMDHPWREKYFQFLQEHSGATFYHAATDDRIHIFYCPSPDRGMWFIPDSGMGPLQAKGLAALKQIVSDLR